ncbi:MAG: hypothetical protein M0P30_00895 [Syntrophorhabdaceae bacterium]|nr:hypothetical protein [Syntrophorhabdaceae bacterium]
MFLRREPRGHHCLATGTRGQEAGLPGNLFGDHPATGTYALGGVVRPFAAAAPCLTGDGLLAPASMAMSPSETE